MINENLKNESLKQITRRYFFQECWSSVGAIALTSLLNETLFADFVDPMAPKKSHFPGKAKRVLFLGMSGGPSQLDLFDYKPKLKELHGKPIPKSIVGDQRYAFIKPDAPLRATERKFHKHGQCGMEISELLPNIGSVADDICLIRSMTTDLFNHAPAELFLYTGSGRPGRPCMGSWVTYGLGSEAKGLPGFVVLHSTSRGWNPGIQAGASCWSSGFIPTSYQGVVLRNSGDPVLNLSNPQGVDLKMQHDSIQAINALNQHRLGLTGDPEIATRVAAFETAYRMQIDAPEITDISKEPKHILEMYGCTPGQMSFANNALLARRLLENGVRFISLYHKGWDHHGTDPNQGLITSNLEQACLDVDQACGALIKDLKQKGLLQDTLVIWGGEFGRTPMGQAPSPNNPNEFLGRDHHPNAYTIWMAGGGVKGGQVLGETDELGFHIIKDRVHVHDLQATILHLLGLDHTRLTFRFQGRDFRLTDIGGELVQKILV
ncbi:MAG: sulfatase [Acidobacteria bacterium]|nr:MAG: sulfatase [Acidobacteriota bacterium]